VFYDGVWSSLGDATLFPDGVAITFNGSIHEVPEPPIAALMTLGLTALWGVRCRRRAVDNCVSRRNL
jgi:hypothetical protein